VTEAVYETIKDKRKLIKRLKQAIKKVKKSGSLYRCELELMIHLTNTNHPLKYAETIKLECLLLND
jgi:hypothetical protein